MATVASLVVKLGMSSRKFDSGVKKAQANLDGLIGRLDGLQRLAKVNSLAVLAQGGLQFVSAVAQAPGALLPLVAVLGTLAAVSLTTKVATAGMGDAMAAVAEGDAQALNKALEKLAPNARAFVKAWAGIREQFKPIQQATQNAMFANLDKDLLGLTRTTLPAAGVGLRSVATELNGLIREGIQAVTSPLFSGQLEKAGTGAAGVIGKFRGSLVAVPTALLAVVNAGMPFVAQLAEMAAGGLKARAEFLATDEGAERMRATIQRGVDTIKSLISIGQNIGRVIGAALRLVDTDSRGVLDTIDRLTGRMADWVDSAAGNAALQQWFGQLAQVAGQVGQVLPHVVAAAQWLFGVLSSLPAPVRELVVQGLAWSIVLAPIAAKLLLVGRAALGLLTGVAAVGKFTAAVGAIVTASTAAQAASARASAGIAARMTAAAVSGVVAGAKIVGSWISIGATAVYYSARLIASQIAAAASATATAATTAGAWIAAQARLAVAWAAMAARSAASAAATAGAWVAAQARTIASLAVMAAGFVAQGAVMLASAAATAAGVVAGWVMMGIQSLANAARMAAAWLIAMGPVGWVIAAVVGLVALIVANWDTVVAWTKAAWDKVWEFIKAVGQFIWDYFLRWSLPGLIIEHWDTIVAGVRAAVRWVLDAVAWLGELPGRVGSWFRGVYDAAVGKLRELLSWLGGLGGQVLSALGNLGSLLVQAGKDLISGMVRGIGNMGNAIREKVMSLVQGAWDAVKNFFGIASPSKLMDWAGRMIGQGLVRGIDSMLGLVGGAADRLAAAATPELGVPRVPGMAAVGSAAAGSGGQITGGGRSLVHIENYHPPADASASDVAHDLDWFSRGGG